MMARYDSMSKHGKKAHLAALYRPRQRHPHGCPVPPQLLIVDGNGRGLSAELLRGGVPLLIIRPKAAGGLRLLDEQVTVLSSTPLRLYGVGLGGSTETVCLVAARDNSRSAPGPQVGMMAIRT